MVMVMVMVMVAVKIVMIAGWVCRGSGSPRDWQLGEMQHFLFSDDFWWLEGTKSLINSGQNDIVVDRKSFKIAQNPLVVLQLRWPVVISQWPREAMWHFLVLLTVNQGEFSHIEPRWVFSRSTLVSQMYPCCNLWFWFSYLVSSVNLKNMFPFPPARLLPGKEKTICQSK